MMAAPVRPRLTPHQAAALRAAWRLLSRETVRHTYRLAVTGRPAPAGSWSHYSTREVGSAMALRHLAAKGYLHEYHERGPRGGDLYAYVLTTAGLEYGRRRGW